MVHHGTEILAQQGRSTEVPAGTAALWDGVRPVECFSAASLVKSTMFIPRALLAGAVPDFDSVFVRTIENSATLRLLTGWLDVSMRQTALDRDAAHTAGRMAVDLLHSALARTRGDVSDSREVLLLQIKDFLDRNLGDADLTLDVVARANAISVRYLHMLFEGTGERPPGLPTTPAARTRARLLIGPGRELPVAETAIRGAGSTARRRSAARTGPDTAWPARGPAERLPVG